MDRGGALYRRFLDGDTAALTALVALYFDGLVYFLLPLTGDYAAAEEAAQETFARLVFRRPKYREEAAFKTWLYTVARNLALDSLRKRKRTLPLDEAEAVADRETVEERVLRDERARALHRAMAALPSEQRQALILFYFEGLPYKEIASVLGRSVHAAENLVYRARQTLKKRLLEEGITNENL